VLLDVGANVDCKAHNLEQFAVMGEMFARSVLKVARPRVGLLSIGEEETKGNDLTREAFPLLKALPIHFIGNVEGRDIFNGSADVIVCDGFVGNVALKTGEGIGRLFRDLLRESLTRTVTAQVGAMLSRKAFNDFRRRWITTNTAAHRCWVCAASASSATARRMRSPSSTAFAWPWSSPRQGSIPRLSRS
jgi:glycerol-3-phosphate acyltransferase PlsX